MFGEKLRTSREHARGRPTGVSRDARHYATIIVNGRYRMAEQRLHTDRTNWTLLFIQTPMSETADYTGAGRSCQGATAIIYPALEPFPITSRT